MLIIFHHNPNPSFLYSVASLEILLDFEMGLTMVVPWSLPEDLQDNESETRAEIVQIYINKVGEVQCIDQQSQTA